MPLLSLALLPTLAVASPASSLGWGFSCRRSAGGEVGVLYAPNTWERLGKSPTYGTYGVAVGGACAVDLWPVSISVGSDLQVFYQHYARDKSLHSGWLTGDVAVTAGSDEWRLGPHLYGDPLPVGAGLTADWLPGATSHSRDGLELRATAYWPVHPNFQVMLLYVVATPRFPPS